MDRQSAIRILDETFNTDFDVNKYIKFIKELFNNFEVNPSSRTVWKEYLDYIESYQLLGSYVQNKKIIDVLVVKLKKSSSRDRARTMQRNFVAKWLSNLDKDAALIAFYGDDPQDWRFSFVKMEYNLVKDEAGKVTVAKELTPAKRYSFLVGVNEPNHTCRSQFFKLIMEEEINPSLDEIEKAFSIDNVTKEFFDEYKRVYLELKESLEQVMAKDPRLKKEFEKKDISTIDFAKKLLGQIVFIYFLQKKGWLGVEKDPNDGFFKWGTGPKNFLRKLFDKEIVHYDNFFNEILEPLFYEALATSRDDDYYSRFNCKIPFLNGGLFEPINDYDWAATEITLDNNIFESILSTFDRFNFTVKEDEPLEKEVAVDPEMLGKVFENLLEVIDRKSKGAFYTPREIVHYMCQQSLINYLETNSPVDRKDIEKFIQLGDLAISNDQRIISEINIKQDKLKKGIINMQIFTKEINDLLKEFNLPISIYDNRDIFDDLLKNIKIIDPAVGSGAFPVGMLNEIIKARSILTIFYDEHKQKERNDYNLKREVIENCLYGVDIMQSAVDITKLRFWLSLIVDELDMKNIKPLPNLDHKIMCGNSLLEEFEGVKLFDEKLLGEVKKDVSFEVKQIEKEIAELYKKKGDIVRGKSNGESVKDVEKGIKKLERKKQKITASTETSKNLTLDEATQRRIKESQRKLSELKQLQKKYFNEQNRKLKKQYRADIDKIEWELIEETLKEQGNEEAIQKLEQYKKTKAKPFFLWKLYFAEVFQRENPGFDVVIANPPYVKEYVNKKAFDGLRESKYYKGKMDLWYFFACKSIDLIRDNGVLTYIAQNNWVTSYGASIMRNKIVQDIRILNLLDFGDYKIFETVGIQTMIMIFRVDSQTDNYPVDYRQLNFSNGVGFQDVLDLLNKRENKNLEFLNPNVKREDYMNKIITFSSDKVTKILNKLSDVSNFKIGEKEATNGIHHHHDFVNKKRREILGNDFKVGEGIFVLSDKEKKDIPFTKKELEIIKPTYTTKELFKYYSNPNNKYWVIYTDSSFKNQNKIKSYPNIKAHLDKFEKVITSDNKPYGLHRAREERFFKGEKIIAVRKCAEPRFTYTDYDCYVSATFYVIKSDRINMKFLTSLLNSKLIMFWLRHKGKMQGNNFQIDKEPLLNLPLINQPQDDQKPFIQFVDQILSITKDSGHLDNPDKQAKVKKLEKEIDQLVYKLYELTPEEIKIVEEFNEK